MAFENAWLTEEEKEKFEAAKLRDMRYSALSGEYLVTTNWVIDREKNIALVDCGVYSREEYEKKFFVIVYKKLDNQHLISLTLEPEFFSLKEEKVWREKYGVELIKRWLIINCKIPKSLETEISKDELYHVLADALSVYGVNGNPDIEVQVKALIEVEGGKYYDGTGNIKWYDNN